MNTVVLTALLALCSGATAEELVPQGLVQMGASSYFSPYALVVDKSQKRISVWKQDGDHPSLLQEFPSDMGKNSGDKSNQGDFRTPESVYFFQQILMNPEIPFEEYGVKAFTTDYPNIFDQRRGKTGSGIWLHAIPETKTLERGSRGCVVVRNNVIEELGKYITLAKTPILIYDKVPMISVMEQTKREKNVENWLARWTSTWQSKSIKKYIGFYSQDFYANKMNRVQWQAFKNELNLKYQTITVSLYSPVFYEHNGHWVIRALQAYRSDQHEDFGEKTLYVQEEKGELKIIGELWSPVEDQSFRTQVARCCSGADSTQVSN